MSHHYLPLNIPANGPYGELPKRKFFARVLLWGLAVDVLAVAGSAYLLWKSFQPSGASQDRLALLRKEPILTGAPGWHRIAYAEHDDTVFGDKGTNTSIEVTWRSDKPYSKANLRYVRDLLPKIYAPKYGPVANSGDGFSMSSKTTSGVAATVTLRAFATGIDVDILVQ